MATIDSLITSRVGQVPSILVAVLFTLAASTALLRRVIIDPPGRGVRRLRQESGTAHNS